MKSWRTTLAGVLLIVGSVAMQLYYLFDNDPNTKFSIEVILGLVTGAGLFAARDNKVTSEEAAPEKFTKFKKE